MRAVYLYSAMADLAMELQDDEMAKACEALYRSITRRRMYITGGIGSSGKLERFTADYDLPDDRMYCESCASVGLMMFAQRMALLTGDAAYCGAVELALHNTVLAGISKDGDRYFYVNPLAVWPDNCLPSTSMSHVKPVRQPWFACACCPPNIARTLASLAQYIGAADERSLYINLLISSRIRARVGSHDVKAELESTYMDNGKVRLTVESDGATEIRLRVPEYLADPVFSIGGTVVRPKFERGYAVFPVDGRAEIEVSAKAAAHFVAANRRVRAVSGQVAMMKGPFVYCLEQTDNGENLPELAVRPDAQLQERLPEPQLPGALPTLAADGVRVRCAVDGEALYGEAAFFEEKTALKAVPYALWCNREPGEMRVWIHARI